MEVPQDAGSGWKMFGPEEDARTLFSKIFDFFRDDCQRKEGNLVT
jgi:hypothetical protein